MKICLVAYIVEYFKFFFSGLGVLMSSDGNEFIVFQASAFSV